MYVNCFATVQKWEKRFTHIIKVSVSKTTGHLQDPDVHENASTAPTKTASPKTPKAPTTPVSEADSSGDPNVSTWVMDSSGFLSPSAAPTLKEVMELMDGVSLKNTCDQRRL